MSQINVKELLPLLEEVYTKDAKGGVEADLSEIKKKLQDRNLTTGAWEYILLTLCSERDHWKNS